MDFFNRDEQAYKNETTNNLNSVRDTHPDINWEDFIKLLEMNGFKEGMRYEFHFKNDMEKEKREHNEEALIYYNTKNGLVIWAESSGDKSKIKYGQLYGMIDYSQGNIEKLHEVLNGCTKYSMRARKAFFIYYIEKGLINYINKLENSTKLLPKWSAHKPDLWFADSKETQRRKYNFRKISEAKIRKLPLEAKEIINWHHESLIEAKVKKVINTFKNLYKNSR